MSAWRMISFLAIAASIIAAWHYYLWVRLVRGPALPAPWSTVATLLIVALGALLPLLFVLGRVLPRGVATPIMWVGYTWMGFAFLLFFLLLPSEIVRLALVWQAPVDPARRAFVSRAIAGAVGLLAFGLGAFGVAAVSKRVGVVRVRVPLSKLPKELTGYTIVQLTDVHVGPTIGRAFVEQIVEIVNALEPDAVAITGDLVDGSVRDLGPAIEPLSRLKARDGVFFVTGNHEYYSGVDDWLAELARLGVRVLRNERVTVREGLDLAGVDDASAHQFGHGHGTDLDKALAGRDPSSAVVLLAHQPKTIREAAGRGIDLQISGHTHGGQIWPWGYLVRLDQSHVAGLSRHDGVPIYVSRGTGYWGPPMRVGAPAEITRIELIAG